VRLSTDCRARRGVIAPDWVHRGLLNCPPWTYTVYTKFEWFSPTAVIGKKWELGLAGKARDLNAYWGHPVTSIRSWGPTPCFQTNEDLYRAPIMMYNFSMKHSSQFLGIHVASVAACFLFGPWRIFGLKTFFGSLGSERGQWTAGGENLKTWVKRAGADIG